MASPQPLTHHEILALVEPFTRRGLHVDLVASERAERRLQFKPVDLASPQGEPLRTTLQLECYPQQAFRLTRRVTHASGIAACVIADGSAIEALLARLDALPPAHQFDTSARVPIALQQQFDASSNAAPKLHQAIAQVHGLTLTLTLPQARGLPADIDLVPDAGPPSTPPIDLPEDLLAVIGWDWARLIRRPGRWVSKLRLHGREPARSRQAIARFARTVDHVALTLAEAPSRFHERHRAARRGVVLRRAIPGLTAAGLVAAAIVAPRFIGAQEVVTQLLILSAPPMLLAAGFCLQELARFEIPPWPRALEATAWSAAGPGIDSPHAGPG